MDCMSITHHGTWLRGSLNRIKGMNEGVNGCLVTMKVDLLSLFSAVIFMNVPVRTVRNYNSRPMDIVGAQL